MSWRLSLLVAVSVVPLLCGGALQAYLDFRSEQGRLFDGLLSVARIVAVSVEADLRFRTATPGTLAIAPALADDDLPGPDAAFPASQPSDSALSLPDPPPLPEILERHIAKEHLPADAVLTVLNSAGKIVASAPDRGRFAGSQIPALWKTVQSRPEGVTLLPATADGRPVVAAHTHIAPFGWAAVVEAPRRIVFAPLQARLLRVSGIGALVLGMGLSLAWLASRAITRPIGQLRRLAAGDAPADAPLSPVIGPPETDIVAQALLAASTGRQAALRQLAESEQRFRALFEHSPSGTILLDPGTTIVIDCNTVAAGYLGYSVEELRGRAITAFVPGASEDRIRQISQAVVDGGSFGCETRMIGRRGPRDLLIAVAPVQVSGRTLVLFNQIDVTDLRRAEAGLRVNEERLELARAGANLGIWDWDVASRTLNWSEHQWFLHGLEFRPEGASAELWASTVHPDDLRRTRADLVAAMKSGGSSFASEYSVNLPDGSTRRLLSRGQVIRGADGRAVRMVGVNMDVTARYEAEMARDRLIRMLEAQRSQLSEIIEAMPLGVAIVDAQGRVVVGNAVMHRLIGPVIASLSMPSRGEWIGHDADGNRVPREEFPIRRALGRGETTLPGMDFLFRDQDGAESWFRVGSIPLRQENGQVQEALVVCLDINAEKRLLAVQEQIKAGLQQQVREEMAAREAAQLRAAHAERMHALGQIAGGVAHDFNNVLQAVSISAAIIERHPQDAERVLRNARMVLDATRRGASITSRLLDFSRRGDLRAEEVDAATLLTDMAEVLTHTLGGSVACKVDVQPGLPALIADRGELETVLVNLATNARDAMPAGGTLTLSADSQVVAAHLPHPLGLAPGLSPGRYVRIMATDTGDGMPEDVLTRVTEPFFTTKQPGKGTGLGLAMAKAFAEQSGGSLSIESSAGQGTRIIVWLPCAAVAPPG